MLLRLRDLYRQVLNASPGMRVGAALRALGAMPNPASWLLLYQRGREYVVLGLADLAQFATHAPDVLLNRTLDDLRLPASPTIPLDTDVEAAQALRISTPYVVVLRNEQPCGLLYTPPTALALADPQALLDAATSWRERSPVLGFDTPTSTSNQLQNLHPLQPRTDRYVNTDFAAAQDPTQPLDNYRPLSLGTTFWFRFHIGEVEQSSIEQIPTVVPDLPPNETVDLRVVIFSESFVLAETTGILRVPADGPASVLVPASVPAGMAASDPLLHERLLFRVATQPGRRGRYDLRVNLYCRGMLVQSRLVTAQVGPGAPLTNTGRYQLSVLDFNLSPALAPRHLNQVETHRLSILMNSDSSGNQSFRLLGENGQQIFAGSATLNEGDVVSMIDMARRGLRLASWGDEAEWDGKAAYRYNPSASTSSLNDRLFQDLKQLVGRGTRLYLTIDTQLGAGVEGAEQLREWMRTPGTVQMAARFSANDIVPIALIYDYPVDSQNIQGLCPAFVQSLAKVQQLGGSLGAEPCFMGECPSRTSETLICPSGFWGYRHDIGSPTPTPYGPDLAFEIDYTDTPLIDMAMYTDFALLPMHLAQLDKLPATIQRQSERAAVLSLLKNSQPQLVYFYCHGMLQDTNPALVIGSEQHPGYLTTDNWSNLRIRWPQARPLIFINGCHTTAISPAQALNLVKVLVERTAAAGVIGTEITIFEELAQPFAETLLPLFLAGVPLGRAMRETRLQLLARNNPLGLVYTPHAYPLLRLLPHSKDGGGAAPVTT